MKHLPSGVARFILIIVIAAYPLLCAAAGEYRVVTTDELKSLLDSKAALTLVDSRTLEEYEEAHIPGAVNISEKGFEKAVALLPSDKARLVVIYCNGVKCGKSKRVAKKLEPLGYTNISLYGEGIPVWEEKGLAIKAGPNYGEKIATTIIKPAELKALIDSGAKDVVVVDVRDANEFAEGHIPGAINIPADQFAMKSDVLPKESRIVVYCNTGSRSYLAYRKLIKLAYPKIYQALLADWKEAGSAIVRK